MLLYIVIVHLKLSSKTSNNAHLFIFLPPYSYEFNLIELLWRKVKYQWLTLDANQSFSHLKNQILDILKCTDKKSHIIFT